MIVDHTDPAYHPRNMNDVHKATHSPVATYPVEDHWRADRPTGRALLMAANAGLLRPSAMVCAVVNIL
jgi:hypothetical protein